MVCSKATYLACNHPNFFPHEAWQYVFQKWQVEVCFLDFELGVARVQGKGGGVRFACFDGAGEEVEGEELHCGLVAGARLGMLEFGGEDAWGTLFSRLVGKFG
jgi:hypothetical protein